MKKFIRSLLFFLISILSLSKVSFSQNVGIGTTTPGTNLHIVNEPSGYSGGYFQGAIIENNNNIYLNFLTLSGYESGVLFGRPSDIAHGGIVYNNANTMNGLQFRTNGNATRMVVDSLGRIGIGNVNPSLAGLIVDTKVGAVNALFGSNTTGVAIESNYPGIGFNTYYNTFRKAIATGYGGLISVDPINGGMGFTVTNASYAAGAIVTMTNALSIKPNGNIGIGTIAPGEKLTIVSSDNNSVTNIGAFYPNNLSQGIGIGYDEIRKIGTNPNGNLYINAKGSGNLILENSATGYVGIGTANPAFKLDVSDRIRIRSGGGFSTAGLYLNSNDNSSSPAFIGMDDDTHVGFYGNGAGWKFSMNTNSGALKINGTEGSAGHILITNGPGSSAQWASIGTILPSYYLYNSMYGPNYTLVNASAEFQLANSTISITVPSNSRLIISANYAVYTNCINCFGSGRFYFKLDGNSTEVNPVVLQTGVGYCSGSLSNYFYDVGPGSHSIVFFVKPELQSGAFNAYLVSATVIVMQQ